MFRHLLVLGALVAAVAIPYLSSTSQNLRQRAADWITGGSISTEYTPPSAAGTSTPPLAVAPPAGGQAAAAPVAPPAVLEGPRTRDLAEVFQFEATVSWITRRWQRVSTAVADGPLQGYRVPLVTGTAEHDLAGSLTYYFDREYRVQKITFFGQSGDPRRLVELVSGRYGFRRETSREPGALVLTDRWHGKPRGQLVVRPSAVVRADLPASRYEIELLLGRQ